MAKQRIIIVQSVKHPQMIYGFSSLKKVCDVFEYFSYGYLKQKRFPFTYKGWIFLRIKLNPEAESVPLGKIGSKTMDELAHLIQKSYKG